MTKEHNKSIDMLLKNPDSPLSSRDLSDLFPYVLRTVPQFDIEDVIHFKPTPGEMSRFGVFFWALNSIPHAFPNGRINILLDTEVLLNACDNYVVERGIAVFPSKYYERLLKETGTSGYDADFLINRQNIVLDVDVQKSRLRPILAIPSEIILPTDSLTIY